MPLGRKLPEPDLPNQLAPLQESPDDYDQHVRELAFEKRAKAKDRTKTEEEIAAEEKEALEKAERERQRRMLGKDAGGSDDERGKFRGKRKRERGADDLEDDFQSDEADRNWLGAGLGAPGPEGSEAAELDRSDSEEEEDDGGTSVSESDVEDAEEDGEDGSELSEGEEGEHEELVSTMAKKLTLQTKPKKELPYTFSCPSSHEELLEIVEEVADEDVPMVIQRIRILYHPSLAADNKLKLQARRS